MGEGSLNERAGSGNLAEVSVVVVVLISGEQYWNRFDLVVIKAPS